MCVYTNKIFAAQNAIIIMHQTDRLLLHYYYLIYIYENKIFHFYTYIYIYDGRNFAIVVILYYTIYPHSENKLYVFGI